jgi:hypothetical protein
MDKHHDNEYGNYQSPVREQVNGKIKSSTRYNKLEKTPTEL